MRFCIYCNTSHTLTAEFWYGIQRNQIECKKKVKNRATVRYNENPEKIINQTRMWKAANPEKDQEHRSKYRAKHAKPRIAAKSKEQKLAKRKERLKTDPGYRMSQSLRKRLRKALKAQRTSKDSAFQELLGCTNKQLKVHIEQQFHPGMTWNNYGAWHLDHIIPLSSFDLTDTTHVMAAACYNNLQPLWARDNLQKGNRWFFE